MRSFEIDTPINFTITQYIPPASTTIYFLPASNDLKLVTLLCPINLSTGSSLQYIDAASGSNNMETFCRSRPAYKSMLI